MLTLRQTILNDYALCPFKAFKSWGEVGKQGHYETNESSQNKYSACGIAFHEVMDYAAIQIKKGIRPSLEELKDLMMCKFKEVPVEMFDDLEDVDKWEKSLLEQVEWIYDIALQSNSIIASEWEFEVQNMFRDVPPITGCVDRIEGNMQNKDVRLMDYKTGKVYTKKQLENNIQACLYSLAFFSRYGFLPKEFVFYFTKHKKTKTIQIANDFLNRNSAEIVRIVEEMKAGHFEPNNKNKYFCKHFCEWQSECPKFKRNKKTGWDAVNE